MIKTKPILFSFIALILLSFNTSAQQCNCPESFEWMVNTFEKNDAGFQYVIDKKGTDDYKKFTARIREKIKTITNVNDCQDTMMEWLRYFRSGHIGVLVKDASDDDKTPPSAEIREKYKNEKITDLTEKELINILEKKKNKNSIEGVWTNGAYTIGIINDANSNKKYTGFIIKADSVYWMPKQIKAELMLNDDNKTFTVDYYMKDHSKETTTAKLINDSGSLIFMHNDYWTRTYPKSSLTKEEQLLVSFSSSKLPFAETLSDKTLYLRIPSFETGQKKAIDSALAKFDNLITTTPNLIIDIRNGTGGSDASYRNIIPYLYTNPIRDVGVQLYSTELNAKAYEKYARQYTDTSDINYCLRVAKKMRENPGTFITSGQTYDIDSLPKVFPYPQKVAILCNHNNGSTDEQFLIEAKQSRKVKVFGRPTGGMLDISNVNFVDFPDGKFVLAYGMSKSYRIPNYCIDGVGIQPDYFIDDAVKENDWIEYTRKVLEQ